LKRLSIPKGIRTPVTAVKGIERRVALFAHLHINKEAAPEMYRLPIQTGRLFAIS
jgi:hypothetical protein